MTLRLALLASLLLAAPAALAGDVTFKDPAGDDFGPGSYTYPTDAVYTKGSFDLREVEIVDKGKNVELRVTVSARIEDPWDSKSWPGTGNGFSVQMAQVYIDTRPGAGFTDALPGINVGFPEDAAWDKVVIISPQPESRVKMEVDTKGGRLKAGVVVPRKTFARGKTLIAVVPRSALGEGDLASWSYQVVMQSNEGFPDKDEILSRKVNEFAGQHRFGGGNDWACDPHVMDILAGAGQGEASEKDAQKKALAYKCGPDGQSVQRAVVPMLRPAAAAK